MENKTVTSLKTIYTKLGGDADDVKNISTIPDVLDEIAKVIPDALAAVLPAVSATDNGSVLKVIDGDWGVGTDLTE